MNTAAGADRIWNQRGNDPGAGESDTELMLQLRANQQLMVSIMDNITEAVYRTGPAHELIYANRAYRSLSGYDSLEEIQRAPRETLYANPADRARLLELLANEGEFRNEEIEYISRHGKHWWGLCNSVAIRDPQTSALLYHVGSVKDITRRKATEQELRDLNATLERRVEERTAELAASEQKFRALFEASSAGVMLHDEHQYLEVNPASLRILGYERAQDLIGKNPALTSPPTQPNGESSAVLANHHIQECMTRGSARFDWMCRSAQGKDIPLEVILTRVEWSGKRIIQAVINDISERKQAEAELLKSLAREKELSALKSSFVSMVSHEFRTPLGIILSSAEILDSYFEQLPAEERKCQLDSIRRNTRRMADLMEEVLVLSRFDAGKMDCKPCPLDLPAFFRRLVDELLSATNDACPIKLSLPPGLTEASVDERLLRHIVTNLVSNAVKYSRAGAPVRVAVARHERDLALRVQDEGIGIPEEDRHWLFNAFHRGRNVGERAGTGLGLVIVKKCIELHGGKLNIESKVNVGTSITVTLPVF